jgi:hypothetical protein
LAVAAAKRKKRKDGSGWSRRLAGIALCAFFALGVITGLSQSGRMFALRIEALLNMLPHHGRSGMVATHNSSDSALAALMRASNAGGAIALIERSDGFYTIDAQGALRGPVSPASQGDLPILGGAGIENAGADRMVAYAAMLVRAEADLSEVISEMRVGVHTATLFFDRPRIEVVLELDDVPIEIARAAKVLALWRGHRELIAALDMTTPGQAVVRLKPAALENANRNAGVWRVAMDASPRPRARHNSPSEPMTIR